jgi:hypothetical protein
MLVPRAMPKLSEDSQHLPEKRFSISQPVGFPELQGQAINSGRLFQKAKLSLIERNSLQPFRILRFRTKSSGEC